MKKIGFALIITIMLFSCNKQHPIPLYHKGDEVCYLGVKGTITKVLDRVSGDYWGYRFEYVDKMGSIQSRDIDVDKESLIKTDCK